MSEVGNLVIYGAGGCGINIASSFDNTKGKVEPGHSCPRLVYLDTSRSNISPDINEEQIMIIEDRDGSGKVRRENADVIYKHAKNILHQHPPGDLSVVVFSGSGGSGSVYAPIILEEIIARGHSVVAIVVGSDESLITAKNTRDTFKSLAAISERQKAPVVIHYSHNARDVARSEVDRGCRKVIAALSLLASRQNSELDTRDIANWIRFDRSTTAKPQVALFDIYTDRDGFEKDIETPISIASLFNSTDAKQLEKTPEYHCAGYPRVKMEGCEELHYVISLEEFYTAFKMIESRYSELEQASRSRIMHDKIVNPDEVDSQTGLVF